MASNVNRGITSLYIERTMVHKPNLMKSLSQPVTYHSLKIIIIILQVKLQHNLFMNNYSITFTMYSYLHVCTCTCIWLYGSVLIVTYMYVHVHVYGYMEVSL